MEVTKIIMTGTVLQILVNENGKFVDKTSQFVDTSKSDPMGETPNTRQDRRLYDNAGLG